MSIDERPDSHPLISNKPLNMSRDAVSRRRQKYSALKTVPYNPKPSSHLSRKERKDFLKCNHGQWGPVFDVMYTCRQLYEEAQQIRYNEVRVYAVILGTKVGSDEVLHERLSHQPILDFTEHLTVEIHFHQDPETVKNLVVDLGKLKSLKYIRLVVSMGPIPPWIIDNSPQLKQDTAKVIIMFLRLNIYSLTIHWLDFCAEGWICDWLGYIQKRWLARYGKSSLYKVPNAVEEIPQSQNEGSRTVMTYTGTSPGEIVKHVSYHRHDEFYFEPAEDRISEKLHAWRYGGKLYPQNPRNHPDQLEKGQTSEKLPVRRE